MRAKQVLQLGVMLMLAGAWTAALSQPLPPCSMVAPADRALARATGACRDLAPIVDAVPTERAPPVVTPVPNVVGLSFDDARNRLAGFNVQRSYRVSGEPGGTVLGQQPAPPVRVASGATILLVLSDGTQRPAPRVPPSEVDAPQAAASRVETRSQPAVANEAAPPATIEQRPAIERDRTVQKAPPAPAVEQLRVPNVIGMPVKSAQAKLGSFKVERRERPSQAPVGRVIEQIPKASLRTPAGGPVVVIVSSGPAPVAETFELPAVTGRSYADAGSALTEFKVNRIDIANAAPSGQVLAQDPAPGTSVPAGSVVALQVSDGSLANTAPAAPVAVPAPATETPAPAAAAESAPPTTTTPPATPTPAPKDEIRLTLPSNSELVLVAGLLLGLLLGVLYMRQSLVRRSPATEVVQPAAQAETAAPLVTPPIQVGGMNVVPSAPFTPLGIAEAIPEIRMSVRLDVGETTIEFTAPADAEEATADSRELHE